LSTASYGVVVVGGGNAAMCAALSAREHGARVLVLEKAPEAWRGGNGFFTAGGGRVAVQEVEGSGGPGGARSCSRRRTKRGEGPTASARRAGSASPSRASRKSAIWSATSPTRRRRR